MIFLYILISYVSSFVDNFDVTQYFISVDPTSYTNIYHIDPTYSGSTPSGTELDPYKDLTFLSTNGVSKEIPSDTILLFKRGTELDCGFHMLIGGNNHVAFSSYGDSEVRPIFRSDLCTSTGLITFGGPSAAPYDIIVDGLQLLYDNDGCSNPPVGIIAGQTTYGVGHHITVQNCVLKATNERPLYNIFRHIGSSSANYLTSSDHHVNLYGNEIAFSNDDTIIMNHVDDVNIIGNYIHDGNKKWFKFLDENPNGVYCPENGETYQYCPGDRNKDIPEECRYHFDYDCGGDMVQLISGDNQVLSHNYIDKSDSGNKFAVIMSNTRDYECTGTVVEYNTVVGPMTVNGAAGAIYIPGRDNVVVRYNKVLPPHNSAIFGEHSISWEIYGNEVIRGSLGTAGSIAAQSLDVHHNLFYDIETYITPVGTPITASNNIFYNSPEQDLCYGSNTITGSNNFFLNDVSDIWGSDNIITDPLFIDPENNNFHWQYAIHVSY